MAEIPKNALGLSSPVDAHERQSRAVASYPFLRRLLKQPYPASVAHKSQQLHYAQCASTEDQLQRVIDDSDHVIYVQPLAFHHQRHALAASNQQDGPEVADEELLRVEVKLTLRVRDGLNKVCMQSKNGILIGKKRSGHLRVDIISSSPFAVTKTEILSTRTKLNSERWVLAVPSELSLSLSAEFFDSWDADRFASFMADADDGRARGNIFEKLSIEPMVMEDSAKGRMELKVRNHPNWRMLVTIDTMSNISPLAMCNKGAGKKEVNSKAAATHDGPDDATKAKVLRGNASTNTSGKCRALITVGEVTSSSTWKRSSVVCSATSDHLVIAETPEASLVASACCNEMRGGTASVPSASSSSKPSEVWGDDASTRSTAVNNIEDSMSTCSSESVNTTNLVEKAFKGQGSSSEPGHLSFFDLLGEISTIISENDQQRRIVSSQISAKPSLGVNDEATLPRTPKSTAPLTEATRHSFPANEDVVVGGVSSQQDTTEKIAVAQSAPRKSISNDAVRTIGSVRSNRSPQVKQEDMGEKVLGQILRNVSPVPAVVAATTMPASSLRMHQNHASLDGQSKPSPLKRSDKSSEECEKSGMTFQDGHPSVSRKDTSNDRLRAIATSSTRDSSRASISTGASLSPGRGATTPDTVLSSPSSKGARLSLVGSLSSGHPASLAPRKLVSEADARALAQSGSHPDQKPSALLNSTTKLSVSNRTISGQSSQVVKRKRTEVLSASETHHSCPATQQSTAIVRSPLAICREERSNLPPLESKQRISLLPATSPSRLAKPDHSIEMPITRSGGSLSRVSFRSRDALLSSDQLQFAQQLTPSRPKAIVAPFVPESVDTDRKRPLSPPTTNGHAPNRVDTSPPRKKSKSLQQFEEPATVYNGLPEGRDNCLSGYIFVVGSKSDHHSVAELEQLIKKYGGEVHASVTQKANFVVYGRGHHLPNHMYGTIGRFKDRLRKIEVEELFDMIRRRPFSVPSSTTSEADSLWKSQLKSREESNARQLPTSKKPKQKNDTKVSATTKNKIAEAEEETQDGSASTLQRKRTFKVPRAPKGCFFVTSVTKRILQHGEEHTDSEDEPDESWLLRKHLYDIECDRRLTPAMKRFLCAWDEFFMTNRVYSDAKLPEYLLRFVRERFGQLDDDARRIFVRKVELLVQDGLLDMINDDHMEFVNECQKYGHVRVQQVHKTVTWKASSTTATPVGKVAKKPPALGQCVCGKPVDDLHSLIMCSADDCVSPEYHYKCVGLERRQPDWRCPRCTSTMSIFLSSQQNALPANSPLVPSKSVRTILNQPQLFDGNQEEKAAHSCITNAQRPTASCKEDGQSNSSSEEEVSRLIRTNRIKRANRDLRHNVTSDERLSRAADASHRGVSDEEAELKASREVNPRPLSEESSGTTSTKFFPPKYVKIKQEPHDSPYLRSTSGGRHLLDSIPLSSSQNGISNKRIRNYSPDSLWPSSSDTDGVSDTSTDTPEDRPSSAALKSRQHRTPSSSKMKLSSELESDLLNHPPIEVRNPPPPSSSIIASLPKRNRNSIVESQVSVISTYWTDEGDVYDKIVKDFGEDLATNSSALTHLLALTKYVDYSTAKQAIRSAAYRRRQMPDDVRREEKYVTEDVAAALEDVRSNCNEPANSNRDAPSFDSTAALRNGDRNLERPVSGQRKHEATVPSRDLVHGITGNWSHLGASREGIERHFGPRIAHTRTGLRTLFELSTITTLQQAKTAVNEEARKRRRKGYGQQQDPNCFTYEDLENALEYYKSKSSKSSPRKAPETPKPSAPRIKNESLSEGGLEQITERWVPNGNVRAYITAQFGPQIADSREALKILTMMCEATTIKEARILVDMEAQTRQFNALKTPGLIEAASYTVADLRQAFQNKIKNDQSVQEASNSDHMDTTPARRDNAPFAPLSVPVEPTVADLTMPKSRSSSTFKTSTARPNNPYSYSAKASSRHTRHP